MIGLFQPGVWDRFRSLSDIERVGPKPKVKGERDSHYVKMRDGETLDILDYEQGALLRRAVQLIPAQHGLSIVRVSDQADDQWIAREPLIAWALCFDGEIRPVAPNGVPDDSKRAAYVEMPDGRIEGVGEWADPCGFENAEVMREHFVSLKEGALDG